MDFREMFEEKERTVFALGNFLKVPAPDKNAGQLYYNEKGEGLLDTFWTLNPEPTKHVEGDKIYWINDQGDRFNVARTEDLIFTNQTRLATTKEDFQIIFNREFKESGLERNSKNLNLFTSELTEHVKKLIELHRANTEFKNIQSTTQKINLPLLSFAHNFIEYLNTKLSDPIEESKQENPYKKTSLEVNPSHLHKAGVRLLEYLYDEYILNNGKFIKVRAMNVWKYLKDNEDLNYKFYGKKEDFIEIIENNTKNTCGTKLEPSKKYYPDERQRIDSSRQLFEEHYNQKISKIRE